MVGAINEIYVNGELPITLRLGLIALIPKGEKDQKFITNWRPLTLLETLYKLISATLANKLKSTLDKIKGKSQMAYIPGRYISECTRNTYDIFTHAKENNLPGMLLFVDFDKAFNCVNFEFIVTTLEIFGFGEEFIKWITIILGMKKG